MPTQRSVEPVAPTSRAADLENILLDTTPKLVDFVRKAEAERNTHCTQNLIATNSALVHRDSASPKTLEKLLQSQLLTKVDGIGHDGLQGLIEAILKYSVNTSAPGFLDKLYGAPLPPGVLAELVLGVLNTNLHVYQVSPVLTIIERKVTKDLANMFGLTGPRSGGISVQGGSASNMTSIVVARNTLFPETKTNGNNAVGRQLVMFTSAHGHYSIEKSAQALGLGSSNVIPVPVNEGGQMISEELERLVLAAEEQNKQPFYVNATAGSTVLGSFDSFTEIAAIAKRHKMWFHVDGAWGGGFVFSERKNIRARLNGIELADSIATNPHKMLGVPVTCSFLLGKDMRQFESANTLKAGYLFHDNSGDDEDLQSKDVNGGADYPETLLEDKDDWQEPYDLADLTLQCGRRGDALKMFFCWQYYGTRGYASMIDSAYDVACHMARLVERNQNLTPVLIKGNDPSCLQICFYFTPNGKFTYGLYNRSGRFDGYLNVSHRGGKFADGDDAQKSWSARLGKLNTRITASITKALIPKGFMIDFAPALEGQEDRGSFFRVVVNISTVKETVDVLVRELIECGHAIVSKIEAEESHRGADI